MVAIESGGVLIHPEKGKGLDLRPGYNAIKQTRPNAGTLVEAARGNDPVQRARAFGMLQQLASPAAIAPMTELILGQDQALAEAAARVLTATEQRDAMASLINAAAVWTHREGPNPVLHIIPHGRHADRQPLIDALGDGDETLRLAAVTCLGVLSQATDFPSLYAATSDSSSAVRAAARAALERLRL